MQADGNLVLYTPGHVTLWSTNTSKQTYAVIQLPAHGWGPDQFGCRTASGSGRAAGTSWPGTPASAYWIPQADPGSKMAAEGSDWLTNPADPDPLG